jgi:DNA-directed RNA polymerase subunit N (RpoN/RPB10)
MTQDKDFDAPRFFVHPPFLLRSSSFPQPFLLHLIMIIPVRCMTCGKVLADKWDAYDRRCNAILAKDDEKKKAADNGKRVESTKTAHGRILDDLEITNLCCRTTMLSHIDLSLVI